ncbi:hypothetical protein [Sphingopyxis sp. Root1497]|uniref:hypothetical protein n=1 Tax=Sphingopyxis sp. Root1497 TaxID=1736474 RepID=UPI000AD483C9|nr:hypothetical protein [Sphingopyxis sp. Root1497]
MQDELWMRNWSDAQPRFSADIDRGLASLAGAIARLRRRRDDRTANLRARIGIG